MPDAAAPPRPSDLASVIAALRQRIPFKLPGLLVGAVVLAAGLSLSVPGFASLGTLQSMMFQVPQLGLLAMAMMIPLMSGGLNLAIIATADASALVMVGVMHALTPGIGNFSILAALAAGCLAALAIGTVTGLLIARTRVHPILVTLGVMSIVQGVCILLTRGKVISGVPPLYGAVGNAVVAAVPVPFMVFVIIAAILAVILRRTPFGISLKLTGSNPEATRFSAVDVDAILVRVYTASGILCFLAATLMVARFNSASADYAKSYLLVTVLASVLGGVDPFGGFGEVSGLVLALFVLQMIATGCNLMGFSDYLTLAIWGLILIAVTALGALRRR